MRKEIHFQMKIFEYGNEQSDLVLIQMVDGHSMKTIDAELDLIRQLSGQDDFRLIACRVEDWNRDLSPREAPPVFGKEGFGGKAEDTLKELQENVLMPIMASDTRKKMILGGYSLAGLFALWAAYRMNCFNGVASASPSVWFPGFVEMAEKKEILTKKVYLSLGDKEEKTKNPVMATVGDSIRRIHQIYEETDGMETTLEWNEGNHFREPELRMAKGFAWVMKLLANYEDDNELEWEEIETEHIIRDEWIDFRKSSYRYPDGRVFSPFYTYSRRDYTVIVASDEEGNYICVRQFRQGIKEVTTEFPAGGIERTDGKEYGGRDAAEAALECAKRELLEETGYVSSDWKHLITIPANATIADNYAYIFMAGKCRKTGEQHLDETECLQVVKHTAEEIEDLIRHGKFQQSVHVLAWLMAKEQ